MATLTAWPTDSLAQLSQSETHRAYKQISIDTFDPDLLRGAVIHFTNEARKFHRLTKCRRYANLQQAAQAHSIDQAANGRIFHTSNIPGYKELVDRLKHANVTITNCVMGENLAVDYILDIADVPFYEQKHQGKIIYIDASTGEMIKPQTYMQFAKSMVDNWLQSPGHRKNLLNSSFNRIGIGVAINTFHDLPALYITQNFTGPFDPKEKTVHSKSSHH